MEKPVMNDSYIKTILDSISPDILMSGIFGYWAYVTIAKTLSNVGSYKVYKNSFQKINSVEFPPDVVAKIKKARRFITGSDYSKQIKKDIMYFYDTMRFLPGFSSSFFLYNLETIRFNNLELDDSFDFVITGNYSLDDNSISFSDEYGPGTIFHELLHMSSSIHTKNRHFSGFCQGDENSRFFGDGINEGYTELLTFRYFRKDSDIRQSGYFLPAHFMALLEKIINHHEMMKMYFQGDLKSLIMELSNYSTKEEIEQFILNMDYIKRNINTVINLVEKFNCQNSIISISNFLIKAYCNKIKMNFANVDIGENEKDTMMNLMTGFVDSIGTYLQTGRRKYRLVDDNQAQNIMLNSLVEICNNKKSMQ